MKSILLALTILSSVAMAKLAPVCQEVILDSKAEDKLLDLYMQVNTIHKSEAEKFDGIGGVLLVLDRCEKLVENAGMMAKIIKAGKNIKHNKEMTSIVNVVLEDRRQLKHFLNEGYKLNILNMIAVESKKMEVDAYFQKGLNICENIEINTSELLNLSDKNLRNTENNTCKK